MTKRKFVSLKSVRFIVLLLIAAIVFSCIFSGLNTQSLISLSSEKRLKVLFLYLPKRAILHTAATNSTMSLRQIKVMTAISLTKLPTATSFPKRLSTEET